MSSSRYRGAPSTLYVKNISDRASYDEIKRQFAKFGRVVEVTIPLDFYSGRPKGFCFVEFEVSRDAEEAQYRMDRQRLFGKEVEIEFARGVRKTPGEMRHRDRPAYGRRDEYERDDRHGDRVGYREERIERSGYREERGGREERFDRRGSRSRSRERPATRRRNRDARDIIHSRLNNSDSGSLSRTESPVNNDNMNSQRSCSDDGRDKGQSRSPNEGLSSRHSSRRNGTRSPRTEMSRSASPV